MMATVNGRNKTRNQPLRPIHLQDDIPALQGHGKKRAGSAHKRLGKEGKRVFSLYGKNPVRPSLNGQNLRPQHGDVSKADVRGVCHDHPVAP